jgi:hypothetical protein
MAPGIQTAKNTKIQSTLFPFGSLTVVDRMLEPFNLRQVPTMSVAGPLWSSLVIAANSLCGHRIKTQVSEF